MQRLRAYYPKWFPVTCLVNSAMHAGDPEAEEPLLSKSGGLQLP